MGNKYLLALAFAAIFAISASQALAQTEASPSSSGSLETIVVTSSTRVQEQLKEVPTNITIIDQEKISQTSAQDLGELLFQEGFQVYGYPAGGQALVVRGMGSNQSGSETNTRVLILLNGRRIGINSLDFTGLANIERIEIIRGPASLQYGPSAMGGVINVITRRGSEDFKAYAEVGVGSYNQNKEKVAFSGKARDLDISFGVTHDFRDDYKTGNGFIWKDSRYGNHTNANLDIGYTFLNNHRIDINYYYLDINGNLCPGMTGEVSYLNPVDPGNIDDFSRTDVSLSNAAFSYEGKTEDNLFNWSLTYGTGRNKESGTWATSIWDLDTLTSFVSYNGDLISSVLGLDYSKYVIKSDSWGELPISSMTDLGVFLTTKLHLLENNLIFSAGGRYDTYKNKYETGELSQHAFTPSIGVAYNPVEWLKLRANYSKGFKMPTPIEVFPQSSGSYTYLFNPGLRPEKSKTFEIGTDVYWSFITGSLTYFHSDWDDKITSVEVAPNMRQNVNLTNSEIAGLEFALSADLGQAFDQDFVLKPYVNLTYLTKRKNKDHTGGNQSVEYLGFDTLTNVARTIMNFGVNFHHPGINLKANINARKMWGMISQTWNNYDMGHGMGRNNSFYNYDNDFIVDLSLEKRLWDFEKFGHLNLKAQINNIFDAFYMPYINYPGPGRNFYVGLAWEY